MIIFNMGLGVSPVLVTTAESIFRLWGAFFSPVVGHISDNARFRFGRRRPFLVVGAILCAVAFPLIWMVPTGLSEWGIFTWFLIAGLLFYTCHDLFMVPFQSMAVEMTPDTHERTSLIAYRTFFVKLSWIFVGWMFFLTHLSFFDSPIQGMFWVSIGAAPIFVAVGIISAASGKERFQKTAVAQPKVHFRENLRVTFRNRAFQLTIAITLLMQIGTYTVNTLGDYLSVYYVFGGDKSAASVISGWSQTAQMITSFASIPLFLWISKRWGKVRGLMINASLLLMGQLSSLVLIDPQHPYLLILGSALVGPGHTGIWILLPSMQADVCDFDELETGRRREGSFNAVQNWVGTLGYSLATWLSGFVLVGTRFDAALGGAQNPDTILWMRLLYAFVPAAAILVIFYLLRRYPLTEARCLEIRAELESRRGQV